MTFPQDPRVDPELESAIESELASRPMASKAFQDALRDKFVSGALDPARGGHPASSDCQGQACHQPT
jgi:hypothetical protein